MPSKKVSKDPGLCPIKGRNLRLSTRTGDVFECTLIFILRKTPAVGTLHLRFNSLPSGGRTMHCCVIKQQKVKGGCRSYSVGRRYYLDGQIREVERDMGERRNTRMLCGFGWKNGR
jgi:hypothetical protein